MTTPSLAMPSRIAGELPGEVREPRVQQDLLAPSIWSDRARLLARPDVVAVELMLLLTVAVLLRQPLTEVIGTAAEPVPSAPAQPAAPVSPLALLPLAPPTPVRHEPRDPFAPLVTAPQAAAGAPPDLAAAVPAPSTAPTAPAPEAPAPLPSATTPDAGTTTVTIKPGDTLGSIARAHGVVWTVLYEANKPVVGSNPHLVRPGTVLTIP